MNYTGNYFNSIYKKSISITEDDLKFIKSIKGKKSAGGKLKEIIEFYKLNK